MKSMMVRTSQNWDLEHEQNLAAFSGGVEKIREKYL